MPRGIIGRRWALWRIAAGIVGNSWMLLMHGVVCRLTLTSGPADAQECDGNAARATDLSGPTLVHELSRLEKRNYAEQGIPMFLACHNLDGNARSAAPATPLPDNAPLAAAFRHCVDMLSQTSEDESENDVAKIVELLAEWDLASGGTRYLP